MTKDKNIIILDTNEKICELSIIKHIKSNCLYLVLDIDAIGVICNNDKKFTFEEVINQHIYIVDANKTLDYNDWLIAISKEKTNANYDKLFQVIVNEENHIYCEGDIKLSKNNYDFYKVLASNNRKLVDLIPCIDFDSLNLLVNYTKEKVLENFKLDIYDLNLFDDIILSAKIIKKEEYNNTELKNLLIDLQKNTIGIYQIQDIFELVVSENEFNFKTQFISNMASLSTTTYSKQNNSFVKIPNDYDCLYDFINNNPTGYYQWYNSNFKTK